MRAMKTNEELQTAAGLVVKEIVEDGGRGWLQTSSGRSGSVIWSFGGGWEHVSFSPFNKKHLPTWEDMCEIRKIFWGEEDWVVEFHPPTSEYVDDMSNCLHLWRPIDEKMPTPPSWMVGRKKGQTAAEAIREAEKYLEEYEKRKEK